MDAAANAQRVLDRVRKNATVIAWRAVSFLGIVFWWLIRAVHAPNGRDPAFRKQIDFIVSGLVVGSGEGRQERSAGEASHVAVG
jgi:hypothetical protein